MTKAFPSFLLRRVLMPYFLSVVFSFLCLLQTAQVKAEVVILTEKNFEHLTQASTGQTTGKWFVDFYAPWCGHCRKLEPIWTELDERLNPSSVDDVVGESDDFSSLEQHGINIAKVDAIENRELAKRFGVRGYPTILYFANRHMYRYKGERTLSALLEFCTVGYLTGQIAQPESVPKPPTWIDLQRKRFIRFVYDNKHLSMLMDDFDEIVRLRKNAAVVLVVMGFLLGMIAGVTMAMTYSGGSSSSSRSSTNTAPAKSTKKE